MSAEMKRSLTGINPFLAELAASMLLTAANRLEVPQVSVRVDGQWFATVEVAR